MALLSLEIDSFAAQMRMLVSYILLAARLALVHHWKDINPPVIVETLQITNVLTRYNSLAAYAITKRSGTFGKAGTHRKQVLGGHK